MRHARLALLLLLGLAAAAAAAAAELAGVAFRDRNGNGVPDPGEEGVSGATVEVYGRPDAGGTLDRAATTAADGSFALDAGAIADGCYAVRATAPPGFRLGLPRRDCPGAGLPFPVGTRRFGSPRGLVDAARAGALLHLALGDSIAEPASGCTLSFPDNDASDYVKRFGERLACVAPGAVTENHAIGGKLTVDLLRRPGLDPDACGPPNLPHPTFAERCDNVYDVIARAPELVTISIGGNDWLGSEPADQADPFDPAEVQASIDALVATRANAQEILSALASEAPMTDVVLNTVYDNEAADCASTDFHNLWIPIWMQVLRDVAWGQGPRFHVAEVAPEYAHEDLSGAACCGERGRVCFDGIHPTAEGSRIQLEKVWEAAGGVSLGARDALGATAVRDLLLPLEELVAVRRPTLVEDRTRGTLRPDAALAPDGVTASVPAGAGELVVSGFDAAPAGLVPTRVVVAALYRTDAPPPADLAEADPYWIEASLDGLFAPPEYTVTGWNTVTPVVGAGVNAPVVNALPDVPRPREVRALLTRNVPDDGRARGSYVFPPPDWSDLATLAVRLRGTDRGNGPDAYRIELDAVWLEVYGYPLPPSDLYRSTFADARLFDPANVIAAAATPPVDDAPPPAPVQYYALREGAGPPASLRLVETASGVRVTW